MLQMIVPKGKEPQIFQARWPTFFNGISEKSCKIEHVITAADSTNVRGARDSNDREGGMEGNEFVDVRSYKRSGSRTCLTP